MIRCKHKFTIEIPEAQNTEQIAENELDSLSVGRLCNIIKYLGEYIKDNGGEFRWDVIKEDNK